MDNRLEQIKYYNINSIVGQTKHNNGNSTVNRGKNRRNKRRQQKKKHNLNIVYANTNGIRGKIGSIQEICITNNIDIAIITETKGKPPLLKGYQWYSKERRNATGGGVAIAVKNEIARQTKEQKNMEDNEQEIIWIEINITGKDRIHIGGYYGPQEKCQKEEAERQYSQITTQINCLQETGSIILAGDFNAKLEVKEKNINQEQSRNGKLLQEMINNTNLIPVNLQSKTGLWTRQNRNNPDEKSIIDYILLSRDIEAKMVSIEVDEKGTMRTRGYSKESDHNTMIMKMKTERCTSTQKIKKWRLNNEEGWKQYNEKIAKLKVDENRNYEEYRKQIISALKETVGQDTITVSNKKNKPRLSTEMRQLREERKKKRKQFCQASKEDKQRSLEEYYKAQSDIRIRIQREEKERLQKTIDMITNAENPRNIIWEMRKKINRRHKEEYDIITENDRIITDPEEARQHVAEYYEQLYTARPAKPGMEKWTEHIQETNKKTQEELAEKENPPDITMREIREAKKKLKRRKANGPDDIPNEIFTEATDKSLHVYRTIINKTVHNKKIPEEWKEGEIISIYKGKGKKGKCSNERGITLSSNFGKLYERIINSRLQKEINISDAQGGGKKKVRTTDHIMTLLTAANKHRNTYITFLDVTKAYDKAWADGLMYAIHKQGNNSKMWTIIKKLNEDLKAKIKTKHGMTRKIAITDSIRQGGVLSVTLYATVMDEIAKEIEQNNIGITMPDGKKIGCLLWMDDVVLIAATEQEMHKMLQITEEIAGRYHIEFGKEKSKIMRTGKAATTPNFKLGEMTIEYCEKYKYLGVVLNNKTNLKDHIEETQKKTEAAYQTIMSIIGSPDFKGIEMKAIWQLIESCIIPIITYGTEGCHITKGEIKKLNSILEAIVKRILMVPISTPREPLYYETGLLDVEHIIMKNKINFINSLRKRGNSLINTALQAESKWKKEIEENKQKLQIQGEQRKGPIKKIIRQHFEKTLKIQGENKNKTKFYMENTEDKRTEKRKKYMTNGTRHTVQNIFMARTRMIEVKCNYKAKYNNLNCRFCNLELETQTHILEDCSQINRTLHPKIKLEEIFNEAGSPQTTAKKISQIRELLRTSAAPTEENPEVEAPS